MADGLTCLSKHRRAVDNFWRSIQWYTVSRARGREANTGGHRNNSRASTNHLIAQCCGALYKMYFNVLLSEQVKFFNFVHCLWLHLAANWIRRWLKVRALCHQIILPNTTYTVHKLCRALILPCTNYAVHILCRAQNVQSTLTVGQSSFQQVLPQ
jgi:hypothetical protein